MQQQQQQQQHERPYKESASATKPAQSPLTAETTRSVH